MWLMEHVMNRKFGEKLGTVIPSIPLRSSAHMFCTNALRISWRSVVEDKEISFIFGNPPFGGIKTISSGQKNDIKHVFQGKRVGNLDYVGCWFQKAAEEILNNNQIQAAFVSTNSICQGQQVETLWKPLIEEGISIQFAHQTFKWKNEAKANAAVYCAVIGFGIDSGRERREKVLYKYKTVSSDAEAYKVDHINAYLIDGRDTFVMSANEPLCNTKPMRFGNMPAAKSLVLSQTTYENTKSERPELIRYVKRFYSAKGFLNSIPQYCIWFYGEDENKLLTIPSVVALQDQICNERSDSETHKLREHYLGKSLLLFHQITQPLDCDCLLIPRHSSERRDYIPMGFIPNGAIIGDTCHLIANATQFDFGILESRMHMTWMRTVCGRLESRYRYSRDLCYNTFPWPQVNQKQKEQIENLATNVLIAREMHPEMTLAELYDPDKMPDDLKKAHQELDFAVDRLYRKKGFESDEDRLQHLFKRYEALVNGEDVTLFED